MSGRNVARAPTASPFRYAVRAPSRRIAPWGLSLWSFRVSIAPSSPAPYTVFPDGCTSIGLSRIPNVPRMLVCVGPSARATQPPVSDGLRLVGFRLWPDVTESVSGMPARDLRDFIGPLPARIAGRFASPMTAITHADEEDADFSALDRTLIATLADLAPPDARIRAAVRAIVAARGEVRMADVAREAGLGLRHLQRRFPETTGLTLREYARVRSLREALAHRLDPSLPGWSRIAAETGFVDHAHLNANSSRSPECPRARPRARCA